MIKNVNITERDFENLYFVFLYHVLTCGQMSLLSGTPRRSQRRRNGLLWRAGLYARCDIPNLQGGSPTPAFSLTKDAAHLLAQHRGNDLPIERYIPMPKKQYVPHAKAVAATHIVVDQAIAQQNSVKMIDWLNEGTPLGIDPVSNQSRTTAITFGLPVASKGAITCRPDSVFVLRLNDDHCLFALEEDLDSMWANKAIARKLPGYRQLWATNYHLTHYSTAYDPVPPHFRILFVAPTVSRRDALRSQAAKLLKKEDSNFRDLWRFVSKSGPHALSAATALHTPIVYRCDRDKPEPLVYPPSSDGGRVTGCPVTTGQTNGQLEIV